MADAKVESDVAVENRSTAEVLAAVGLEALRTEQVEADEDLLRRLGVRFMGQHPGCPFCYCASTKAFFWGKWRFTTCPGCGCVWAKEWKPLAGGGGQ